MINIDRLKKCLNYDPETGLFYREIATARCVKIGNIAGSVSNGYIRIKIDGKRYQAHILAWFYVYGKLPDYEIDHIDGNRSNNSIINLRDVTKSINVQNQKKAQSDNKSTGLLGAYSSGKKYKSSIRVDGENKYLGIFETAELAHGAYINAKRKYHEGCTI